VLPSQAQTQQGRHPQSVLTSPAQTAASASLRTTSEDRRGR